jgi:hypothetical protein
MHDEAVRTELPVIAECRLDVPGLQVQRERYRRLGESVEAVERAPQAFTVRFDDGLDAGLLEETLAVERECCPFFGLAFDAERRRLTVSVEDHEQAPALDALLFALSQRS